MIDGTYFLLNVFLLCIGTFSIRGFFIFLSSRVKIPIQVRELFTFIPAAVFPALVVPATFFHQGSVEFLWGRERFFVLVLAGIACLFVRSTLFVIGLGLGVLYLVRLLV